MPFKPYVKVKMSNMSFISIRKRVNCNCRFFVEVMCWIYAAEVKKRFKMVPLLKGSLEITKVFVIFSFY